MSDFRVELGRTCHHRLQPTELRFEIRRSSLAHGSNNWLTKDGLEDFPAPQKKNLGKNLRENLDVTGAEDEHRKTGF